MGAVTVIAWDSNELWLNKGEWVECFQLFEMSKPVTPPRPTWRGVWEKEKLLEKAAGVAESSGWIQVSVKSKMLSVDCKEKAEMKSTLLTADWQFYKPTEKEGGAVEEVEMGRKLAGLHCRLCVMLDRGWETTGMVLKHMIRVERKRTEKVSVWKLCLSALPSFNFQNINV